MPELPEVEVSRMGIEPHLTAQTITAVVVRDSRLRWPVPDTIQLLVGQTIEQVRRRAKYLLIDTSAGTAILHLGMSGSLRVVPLATPAAKHDHVDIQLSSGHMLRLNDPRRFGCLLFDPQPEEHELLASLGPEPLTDAFDGQRLFELSRNKKSPVKNFIMDNKVVVGVGNIYANESLFRAGIHPLREAGKISLQRYLKLAEHIKLVLAAAIKQGGTTLKDFSQVDGSPGYFAQTLYVYGRGGKPCFQCERELKEVKVGQRTTVYCGHCQR
ncbi:formamidopyrimidine-DNA glycosylase [Neiella marina]|uniref:Formamidopyrimidine-DNA glycosylase n=1 Tax=Neiella marina TaxID=508461 RepID=A0A8J2UB16_9GAMM|nr:bifunctional DNA-formamidopyrimidine glycosylase/DNA-(apurinic or apyrimidinic site) lyase [Neiella marina]GGA90832.1 formamidopyrimidine-DNA glycosylase [Neiella marina]